MAQEKNPQKVRDVMTANPQTVTEKDSVLEVARIMRDKDTGVVPVVDVKKIIGLVTDRDIVVRCVADGKEIKNCSVAGAARTGGQPQQRDRRHRLDERLADESNDDRKVGQAVEDISRGPANN